jgi:aspartyl-tRNA(Asn)/glutamyl-tRNA(Gln) amidotransferase subunit B
MRFDVNVSVSKDPNKLGTRSETKNLNSFKSVERAVDYEIKRQIELLEKDQEVLQETRGWLDDKQKTVAQRSKENAHDYRYFPDPDIPPITLDNSYIENIKNEVPVMPNEWREKLLQKNIDKAQIESLLESQVEFEADFLDLLASAENNNAKNFANWVINIEVPLRRELREKSEELLVDSKLRKKIFDGVSKLIQEGKLSSNNAKTLIIEMLIANDVDIDIELHAKKSGFIQVSDTDEIRSIVQQVIDDNPKASEEVKNGETKVIGFLVGQVMKESKGKANPGLVQKILKEKLGV